MTLPPIVDDIGIAIIEHGERGDLDPAHPEACLCGQVDPYYLCDGPGVMDLVVHAVDNGHAIAPGFARDTGSNRACGETR